MPRRSVLSPLEWEQLLAVPTAEEDLAREYTFTSYELGLIGRRRGDANRLGFAVQLAYLRCPGTALGTNEPAGQVVEAVAVQLGVDPGLWAEYGKRDETRREHAAQLQEALGLRAFTDALRAELLEDIQDEAFRTDKGQAIAEAIIAQLREWGVLLPTAGVLESIAAEAVTRGNRLVYEALASLLETEHRRSLDRLLGPSESGHGTLLGWLRQSPLRPNSRHVREHLERLRSWRSLGLPEGLRSAVPQNRLLKLAREGAQMTPGDLAKFEPQRRYATLAALAVESSMTITDEVLDLNDRILGKVFTAAKNRHRDAFHDAGKEINDKVRLYGRIGQILLDAKDEGTDPFEAIDSAIGWDAFRASVADAQALARPQDFDSLPGIRHSYAMLRRYAPEMLESFEFKAAPAAKDLLEGIQVLRRLNRTKAKELPDDAPTSFVKPRWARLVRTPQGIDRQFWELCVLAEIRNALRSGDLWVVGSRQYSDFDSYLIPEQPFAALRAADRLPLTVPSDPDQYLYTQIRLLESRLDDVAARAGSAGLPGVDLAEGRLRITPADPIVPDAAAELITTAAAMLPRIPVTDLLVEVNNWTGFADRLTHLKTGDACKDTTALLTVVLADGINLGLVKMAEACPGSTYQKMLRLQAMHIRDETYAAARAVLVNAQHRHPFAAHWGDGTTSSSDGQRFRAGSHAESTGHVNPKYGSAPGRLVYTHISDHYAPFHTALVNVGVRDATYVIDGLLHHETELEIKEHYTDTAGYTDHVFALTHLLGYRFAPRIRDLADTRLYTPKDTRARPELEPLIGGKIDTQHIRDHWHEILRLAASIKTGTVTASLMLRKLGAYPRQNGLARALRELGRLERTLFVLDWLSDPDLRRRTTAGLNKGEARNALARAVFFNRLGEIRDRSFEHQRYRASGLNLLTAAIVHWNTVYLERAIDTLREKTPDLDPELFQYLSPLGWEHINLTGNYTWRNPVKPGRYRQLRHRQA